MQWKATLATLVLKSLLPSKDFFIKMKRALAFRTKNKKHDNNTPPRLPNPYRFTVK